MAMRWYVIHAYSGYEKKVATTLKERIELHSMQDRFGEPMCECGAKPGESCGEDSDRTFEVPELMETSSPADPARESTAV